MGILINALKKIKRRDVVEKKLGMYSSLVKEISQYQVYLDLFTFYVGKDLRTKIFVALLRKLQF